MTGDLFDQAAAPKANRLSTPRSPEPEPAPKVSRKAWQPNEGRRPVAGTTMIFARIAVLSREHVEARDPHPASYWTRWSLLGEAGDIIEWRRA